MIMCICASVSGTSLAVRTVGKDLGVLGVGRRGWPRVLRNGKLTLNEVSVKEKSWASQVFLETVP